MKPELGSLRRLAAVGILSFGVQGARIAEYIDAISTFPEDRPYTSAQEMTSTYTVDFSNWPSYVEEGGCINFYPDPETGEFQIRIDCPDYSFGSLLPGVFRDFELDLELNSVNGGNVAYGPIIVTNRQTIREREHRFLISDQNMFRYIHVDYDHDFNKTLETRILYPLPITRNPREGYAKNMRIIRKGGNIKFMSNGVPVFDSDILLSHELVDIGFAVTTPRNLQLGPHVSIRYMNVRYQRASPLIPPNLSIMPSISG